MKILRLLRELIFPFDIVWRTPEQPAQRTLAHARGRQPIEIETAQSLNANRTPNPIAFDAMNVLQSASQSQAGNAPGKPVAA